MTSSFTLLWFRFLMESRYGKQEFRRADFGSRLLAAEGVPEVKQYPSGSD